MPSSSPASPSAALHEGLPLSEADELLQVIGLRTQQGGVRADLRRKHEQVFRLIDEVLDLLGTPLPKRKLVILDCGCGKSYLSFALNAVLTRERDRKCVVYGLDSNPERIRQAEALRERSGFDNMEFLAEPVRAFRPPEPIDLLLSLHACDTATDEAIAKGMEIGARALLVVPCCHRELLSQMREHPLQGLSGHGLPLARAADALTDGLRALALEAAGYETRVTEYVSPLVTPRNLLLRAAQRGRRNTASLARYQELVREFHVEPTLQRLVPWLAPRREAGAGAGTRGLKGATRRARRHGEGTEFRRGERG
jgi:methyltransferase family protein